MCSTSLHKSWYCQLNHEYSGPRHTSHSSGQIEWSNNSVDDKSIQVGGKQRIIAIDAYIMPVVSKEGLMYLEFIGKPTNEDHSI